jgi:hypothetical protein
MLEDMKGWEIMKESDNPIVPIRTNRNLQFCVDY